MDRTDRLDTEDPSSDPRLGERPPAIAGRNLGILTRLREAAKPQWLFAAALLVLVGLVWAGGYPGATDAWAHLYRAEYLAEQVHDQGWQAIFSTSWMPQWYLGDLLRSHYPPLTTLLLTPIVFAVQDPLLSFKLISALALTAYGALMYRFLDKVWGRWPAALGASLAIWAPYQLRTLFFEGNLPRGLSLIALPVIAWATERLLSASPKRMRDLTVLALGWLWAVLSHPQQAATFAAGFAIYVGYRLVSDPEVPLRRAGRWIGGLAIGLMLTAPWLLPAYSGAELPNVPFLPAEKVELFSAPLGSVLPLTDPRSGAIQVGAGVLILALIAAAARPNGRRRAWLIAGLIAAWLSLGSAGVAFNLLPLHDLLLPERFLNFTSFALAIAAAGLVPMWNRTRTVRFGIVIGLFLMDTLPSLPLLTGGSFPATPSVLAQRQSEVVTPSARTALLTYPEPTSLDVYYAGQQSNLVTGWSLENTPHHAQIRRVLGAPSWSPEHLTRLFGMWNVEEVIVRGDSTELEPVQAMLLDSGYERSSDVGEYAFWRSTQDGSPVQALPPNRMLVLGERPQPLLMAFPFAEESTVAQLSDLSLDELSGYPAVAIQQFADTGSTLRQSETILEAYLHQGGVVIADGCQRDGGQLRRRPRLSGRACAPALAARSLRAAMD
jgi:hypothetical protein